MTNLKMFLYSRALYEYDLYLSSERLSCPLFLQLFVLNSGEKVTLRINGGWAPVMGHNAMCFEKNTLEITEQSEFELLYAPKLSPNTHDIISNYGGMFCKFSFKELEEIIGKLGGIDYIATMDLAIKNFEKNV